MGKTGSRYISPGKVAKGRPQPLGALEAAHLVHPHSQQLFAVHEANSALDFKPGQLMKFPEAIFNDFLWQIPEPVEPKFFNG